LSRQVFQRPDGLEAIQGELADQLGYVPTISDLCALNLGSAICVLPSPNLSRVMTTWTEYLFTIQTLLADLDSDLG
jgi:hypothetical protein